MEPCVIICIIPTSVYILSRGDCQSFRPECRRQCSCLRLNTRPTPWIYGDSHRIMVYYIIIILCANGFRASRDYRRKPRRARTLYYYNIEWTAGMTITPNNLCHYNNNCRPTRDGRSPRVCVLPSYMWYYLTIIRYHTRRSIIILQREESRPRGRCGTSRGKKNGTWYIFLTTNSFMYGICW